jgi:hypothetical protein
MSSHEVKKVISDSVNISGGHDLYTIKVVGTAVNYNLTSTNGTVTNSQMLFNNVNLPSLSNSVINRLFRVRYQVTVGATALPPVALPGVARTVVGATMALADFPLSTCTDSLQVIINSQTATVPLRQALGMLKRQYPKGFLRKYATECPTMADETPALAPESLTATCAAAPGAVVFTGFPVSNQPLSSFYNTIDGMSRASFMPIASTATSATYEVVEPVLCSPLSIYDRDVPFSNFNTLSVQYSMSSLGQMFTMAKGAAYPAGYTVTLGANAYLELVVASIDNTLISVPRSLEYHYENVQVYTNALSGQAVGLTTALKPSISGASQTLRLQNMPAKIIIACRPSVQQRAQLAVAGNPSYADAYLQWGPATANLQAGCGLSISLNNRSGLCASMSLQQLWRVSSKNGLNQSFPEWLLQGGVAIFTPADLGLSLESGDLYEGLSGNVNLTVSGIWNNSNFIQNAAQIVAGDWAVPGGGSAITDLEVVITTITSGVAYIQPDSCNFNTAYLTAAEVNSALKAPESYIPEKAIEPTEYGGALWSSAKSVINSTARGIQSLVKEPLFHAALQTVRDKTGGAFTGGAVTGGVVTGGKIKHKKK